MSEFNSRPPKEALLSPVYWDGIDILSGQAQDMPTPEITIPRKREYLRSARTLFKTLSLIEKGAYTEVKYTGDPRFSPDANTLPDGTVLILDTEAAAHSPDFNPEGLASVGEGDPPIFWPYADYWATHRDTMLVSGREVVGFPEQSAIYERVLIWGVLSSRKDGARSIQRFRFINVPTSHFGDFFQVHSQVAFMHGISLPTEIGYAFSAASEEMSSVSRLRQIDIIHPARAEKSRTARRRKLGRFALHSSGVATCL